MSVLLLSALLTACTPPSAGSAGTVAVAGSGATPLRTTPVDPPAQGLTYEIYVRSFQDSDGDGFGDLDGVRDRLPYLVGLGVRTIWLMPVFPAFGPAGYDVTDFDRVDADYGDTAALRELVDEAHRQGLRVLLDLPFNHVHVDHPWFQDAEAGGPYRDWFVHRDAPGDGVSWFDSAAGGSYYAYFGEQMPDLDWENPDVYDVMVGVLDQWLDTGADGYRLDAVLMLVEDGAVVEGSDGSHALLADLHEQMVDAHPDVFFLAEASEWEVEESLGWLGSAAAPEADAVLDFPRQEVLLDAVRTGRVADLVGLISIQAAAGADGAMAPFLGSHDLDRLGTTVTDASARRALMAAHLLLPGAPVLYYGEELDLANARSGTGQDYAMRAPMPWDGGHEAGFTDGTAWFPPDPAYLEGRTVADEAEDPASMLSLVSGLGCLRGALSLDAVQGWTPFTTPTPGVLAFERSGAAGRLVVAVNLSSAASGGVRLPLTGTWIDASTGVRVSGTRDLSLGRLAPWGWRVLTTRATSCELPVGVSG